MVRQVNHVGLVGSKAGHNQQCIGGSMSIISIDTIDQYFWSHFINVIYPSVKDFLFFNDSIDNQS
jgi:hypothetical protein